MSKGYILEEVNAILFKKQTNKQPPKDYFECSCLFLNKKKGALEGGAAVDNQVTYKVGRNFSWDAPAYKKL